MLTYLLSFVVDSQPFLLLLPFLSLVGVLSVPLGGCPPPALRVTCEGLAANIPPAPLVRSAIESLAKAIDQQKHDKSRNHQALELGSECVALGVCVLPQDFAKPGYRKLSNQVRVCRSLPHFFDTLPLAR